MARGKLAKLAPQGLSKQGPDQPVKLKGMAFKDAASPRIREAMRTGHRAGRTYEVYDPIKHRNLGGMV